MCFFRKKNVSSEVIEKIKKEELDLRQIFAAVNERNEAQKLYKELCSILHPDRFSGDESKQVLADEYFKQVQENRMSLAKLTEIKKSIKDIL